MEQLDRIEKMLERLVSPEADDRSNPMVQRVLVRRSVIEMFAAILRHSKIDAIKEYRALTGFGLKESKDAIEAIYTHCAEKGS